MQHDQPSDVAYSPAIQQVEAPIGISPLREQKLRQLLDGPYEPYVYGNYESALDSGLIDAFYYDEQSGEDAIVHILSGDKLTGQDGATIVGGFHHEPSGGFAPWNMEPSLVDRTHLVGANKDTRRLFSEHYGEPYFAHIAVDGLKKVTLRADAETGEPEVSPVNNSMFPKEYDALAVLQAIRIARDTRDTSQDVTSEKNGRIITVGYAPMLDNTSKMKIRLILDAETGKVITATPFPKKSGIMKLDEAAIDHFVYGEGASQRVE